MNKLKAAIAIIFAASLLQGSGRISAQTPLARIVIDDGKGDDAYPNIVALGGGKYAVLWARIVADYESLLYGRVVDIDGRVVTPVRKNLLGTKILNSWNYDVAPQTGGIFLIAASHPTNRSIVSRRFGSDAKPLAPLNVATSQGEFPTLATGPSGTVLGFRSWATHAGLLDASGRVTGDLLEIRASTASNYFMGDRLVPAPGGFLFIGREVTSGYSERRAAGSLVSADASSATKTTAYEGFKQNISNFYLDAAFEGSKGLVLFGSGVLGSSGLGYYRRLKPDGKPAAPAKRFPVSNSELEHLYGVSPLSGTGRFVCSWLDGMWDSYLQIRKSDGTAAAAAVPISSNISNMASYPAAMAYDADTHRILVAWCERSTAKDPTNVWIGVFETE